MSAGKGDTPRPVDFKVYGENYDNIFRKMDTLFEMTNNPSPRVQWMREKGIYCAEVDGVHMAYKQGTQASAKASTEEEACLILADKLKTKNWKQ
jgi:hypothetical protein